MVGGWRRAFCTAISKDKREKNPSPALSTNKIDKHQSSYSPRMSSKLGFFSNPSNQNLPTPTLRCRTTNVLAHTTPTSSLPNSPKTAQPKPATPTEKFNSPKQLFQYLSSSDPSSPRSPSTFSLLKSTLHLSKTSCGICTHSVRSGQGTAIFTSECNHVFHFLCVATQAKSQGPNALLACPVCGSTWSEPPFLPSTTPTNLSTPPEKTSQKKHLRVYDDDEPLISSSPGSLFVPIPETEENDTESDNDDQEFQGFFPNPTPPPTNRTVPEVVILPESTVVSTGRIHETRVVVLKVRAPPAPSPARGVTRPPIDLVALLDVSENMSGGKSLALKQAMGSIISSLGPTDRLSIVVFSSSSKRLLPLRRMTTTGKSSARRILHSIGATGRGMSVNDALKKAAKVIEDRREKNPLATIVTISRASSHSSSTVVSTMRFSSGVEIPVRFIYLSETDPHELFKNVGDFLSATFHDVKLQLGFACGSGPGEISAVYPLTGRTVVYPPGSVRVGDLHPVEERDFLVELKVAVSYSGSPHVLTVRPYFKESWTQEFIACNEQSVLVPRPQSVGSSVGIQLLRNVHVTTRAIAESRRMLERAGDVSGAYHLLNSARALLIQSGHGSASDCLRSLEVELAELNRRNHPAVQERRERRWPLLVEEKAEVLTPTSAWRAAERLAKVAIMRKHMNKVSDLHGFENARF